MTRLVIKPRGRFSLFDGSWSDSYVLDPGNAEWRTRDVRYAPGDLLWVREAWNMYHEDEDEGPERCVISYRASEHDVTQFIPSRYRDCEDIAGLIDDERFTAAKAMAERWRETWTEIEGWRPSIHMPRWASRITLQVEAVKVERLQEISEEDATAEGAARYPLSASARMDFRDIWQSIHGACAWDANPWVVALTFARITP